MSIAALLSTSRSQTDQNHATWSAHIPQLVRRKARSNGFGCVQYFPFGAHEHSCHSCQTHPGDLSRRIGSLYHTDRLSYPTTDPTATRNTGTDMWIICS
jgi:hypothetical protein